VSARKGKNRKTIALRPGRYSVRVAAVGGNAGSRSVRVT
jgi:hypothetical protein